MGFVTMIVVFVGLSMAGNVAIMGLDDRRSLMLRTVSAPQERGK